MTTTPIPIPVSIDLEKFISDEAHDLRSPFNHIIGFSKMILNTLGDLPLSEIQKEDLGTVYRSGLRSLTLVNGLIDIARINRHEKMIESGEVNLQRLKETSLANWRKFNPASPIQPEIIITANSATISADENMLRQVIIGFISFTTQFCDIEAHAIITIEERAGNFLFTIAGKGKKIKPPSSLDLELIGYVNRSIIELHHGELISAEENDEGAVVQFTMPGNG